MTSLASPFLCRAVTAGILCIGMAGPARAADDDSQGRQLLRECEAAQSMRLATLEGDRGGTAAALNAGLCLGVLQALSDLNELLPQPLFCPPSGALIGEAVRVVVDGLRGDAGGNDGTRTAAALGALRAAYPCRR